MIAPSPERPAGLRSLKAEFVLPLDLKREGGAVRAFLAFARGELFPSILERISADFHAYELRHYARLKHRGRQASYALGRWACKLAAGAYLGESDKGKIEIGSGSFNQPIVRHGAHEIPEITLAHTPDLALAIAYPSGHIMGVDVEPVDGSKLFVYQRVLTPSEQSLARSLPTDFLRACNLMWTVKEALSKAIKCGLMTPFEVLEIQSMTQETDGRFLACFRNFSQYKCISWLRPDSGLSIVLPRKTDLTLDPSAFFRGEDGSARPSARDAAVMAY
ncbi:MAG TPA: 4'-phosphopantetheinyl transferase superfamily protein [Fibrobacteria bacterium]|nr:4'-phosphopantetheinyl transferase superfamily protein [Fibrobacteria bacterium]